MRRVVYDANVWFSSIVFPVPLPRAAIDLSRTGQVEAVTSEAIIDQVRRALARIGWSRVDVTDAEVYLRQIAQVVAPTIVLTVTSAKPSDNRVLECAVAGAVGYIVSGDKKHLLPLGEFRGIRIVAPRDFVRAFTRGLL